MLRHELADRGVADALRERGCAAWRRGAAGGRSSTRQETLRCDAVVLASGGAGLARSSARTGAATSWCGRSATAWSRPSPRLTRIRATSPFLKHVKGVKVDGGSRSPKGRDRVSAAGDGAPLDRQSVASGEILFTETGLSGPPILDLSRRAGERAQRGEGTLLLLDLCPEIATSALDRRSCAHASPGAGA